MVVNLEKELACLLEKEEEVSQVGTSRPCLAQESGLAPPSLAGESPLAPGGAVSAGRRGEHKTLVSESGPRLCWLSSLGRMEESTLGGTLDVCSGAWAAALGAGGWGRGWKGETLCMDCWMALRVVRPSGLQGQGVQGKKGQKHWRWALR